MKAFLSTCLVLALFLPAVAKLLCESTKGGKSACEIEKGGFCYKHQVHSFLNERSKNEYEKGCSTNCPSTNYSFHTSQGYLVSKILCCQNFFCNGGKPFQFGMVSNSLKCPFYHTSGQEDCLKKEEINCYNDETRCVEFVLAHNDSSVPDTTYYGCATPSFCKLVKNRSYSDYFGGTIIKAGCGDPLFL